MNIILNSEFFNQNPIIVAKTLLGKVLIRNHNHIIISGRIIETEAYLGQNDEAAHSFKGQTNRNKSLFKKGGTAYIHSIHMQNCLDVVTEGEGIPTSVLIRALKPIEGIEFMKSNRNKSNIKDLASGPGKLTQALKITKSHDGLDLTDPSSEIFVIDDGFIVLESDIISGPRIGISKAKDAEYRFYIKI